MNAGQKMLLTMGAITFVDYAALFHLNDTDELDTILVAWLLLGTGFVGFYGAKQALLWMAYESPWADRQGPPSKLSRLAQMHHLLRLVSGCTLLFGLLGLVLEVLEGFRLLNHFPYLLELISWHWVRLFPLGLSGFALAPCMYAFSYGKASRSTLLLAMLSSGVVWAYLYLTFQVSLSELIRSLSSVLAFVPLYGFGLTWGGIVWWCIARFSGRSQMPALAQVA